MKRLKNFIWIVLIALSGSLPAQDVVFSQFYTVPLMLNPALAGGASGKFRINTAYRDQWGAVLDKPFNTVGAGLDTRFTLWDGGRTRSDFFGAGVFFFRDQVNDLNFSNTSMSLYLSYHKALNKKRKEYLSAGLQLGINQQSITLNTLFFSDQFNGTTGYTLSSAELSRFPDNNVAYQDMAIGINYTVTPSGNVSYYVGGAIHHVAQPETGFFSTSEDQQLSTPLFRKYTLHGAMSFDMTNKIALQPRIIITSQGPHFETNAGANFRLLYDDDYEANAINLGFWARPSTDETNSFFLDAAVVMVGFELRNFILGLSYDLHLKDLGASALKNRSAFEVTITYVGDQENETVICPSF